MKEQDNRVNLSEQLWEAERKKQSYEKPLLGTIKLLGDQVLNPPGVCFQTSGGCSQLLVSP